MSTQPQPSPPNPYEGLPPDHRQRWICIYPAYINSRRTLEEGRRIPKERAADNPLCTEIRDVCISQGFNVELEPKRYPRQSARDQLHLERIRVQLKNADGSPCDASIKTKKELFLVLGDLIPKLKSRQGKGGGAAGAESSGGQSGGGSKKKKGKRK